MAYRKNETAAAGEKKKRRIFGQEIHARRKGKSRKIRATTLQLEGLRCPLAGYVNLSVRIDGMCFLQGKEKLRGQNVMMMVVGRR